MFRVSSLILHYRFSLWAVRTYSSIYCRRNISK